MLLEDIVIEGGSIEMGSMKSVKLDVDVIGKAYQFK